MAFRTEAQPWVGAKQRSARSFELNIPLERIISTPITLMDNIKLAAATGEPRDIERAKNQAWKEGRLKGVFAAVVLFNAEK